MKIFGFEIAFPKILTYFDAMISSTGGKGPSSGKYGWVLAVTGGVASAAFMTVMGTVAFSRKTIYGDATLWGTFWVACLGLWTAVLGFVSQTKRHQTDATKEITLAGMNPQGGDEPDPPETTVTKAVTASETTTSATKK